VKRTLSLFLLVEPYLWLIVVFALPRCLWDMMWYRLTNITFPQFSVIIVYSLLIIVPVLSLKAVHRKSLIRTSGLRSWWPYLFSSLAVLVTLAWLCLDQSSFDVVIFCPIAEESFFRMYLFGVYLDVDSPEAEIGSRELIAFLASNVAFVGYHYALNPIYGATLGRFLQNPSVSTLTTLGFEMFGLFSAGAFCSIAYLVTETVLSSISIHAMWNAYASPLEGKEVIPFIGIFLFVLWFYLCQRENRGTQAQSQSDIQGSPRPDASYPVSLSPLSGYRMNTSSQIDASANVGRRWAGLFRPRDSF